MNNKFEQNVSAVVVQDNYLAMNAEDKSWKHKIWGKSILDWTISAVEGIPCSYVENIGYSGEELCDRVKNVCGDAEYVFILYADTPLLTINTLKSALDMLIEKQLDVVRMSRGIVIKNSYLKTIFDFKGFKMFFFDEEDFIIASSYKQLALISDILKQRILSKHMDNGVYIMDMSTTHIDADVVIESGAKIYPNNSIKGNSTIKRGAVLFENNIITSSQIESGANVRASVVSDSSIGANSTIGPNAYIRDNSIIGENCRIGDFVEIKKSTIGNETKMAHLTYVGDAVVGAKCNIGCGVVFVNYDGKNKFNTIVEDEVFVGSNCNLIAPLRIYKRAFIAAGSTVTQNVPEGKMCIGRVRQEIKDYKSNYLKED